LNDARFFGRTSQMFVVFRHFLPEQEALLIFLKGFVIRQFLSPRLNGKVTLPQRDERFARIGVLNDEITGITGKFPVFNRTLCARTDADHFGDINEMVRDCVAAIGASLACFSDGGDKVTEVGVFEDTGEFACGPEFRAVSANLLDAFESICGRGC